MAKNATRNAPKHRPGGTVVLPLNDHLLTLLLLDRHHPGSNLQDVRDVVLRLGQRCSSG
jgi:hypothetical protein